MNYLSRIQALRQSLASLSISNMIVSQRENITYLTGVHQLHPTHREALLFISPVQSCLYHSSFLTPPPHSWLRCQPMTAANPLDVVLPSVFQTIPPSDHSAIAIEAHDLTVAEHQKISHALPHHHLIPTTHLLQTLRQNKDADEIACIQKACLITRRTMRLVINLLKPDFHPGSDQEHNTPGAPWSDDFLPRSEPDTPGVSWSDSAKIPPGWKCTELSLSHLIEQKLYDFGADGLAFPPIVAFGSHTALPHHQPNHRPLRPNTVILLDFGATYQGYCADMSRTIFFGTPLPDFPKIEAIVKAAYTAGLNLLQQHFVVTELTAFSPEEHSGSDQKPNTPGVSWSDSAKIPPGWNSPVSASDLDITVRNHIAQSGYGNQFIHTTGHALGLELHEQPSINAANTTPLLPGMAITLEPGIYLPGKFGYRHENTLLLT